VFNWRHRKDLFSGKHRQYGMNVQVVADLHAYSADGGRRPHGEDQR
jgi:hypothetical protein